MRLDEVTIGEFKNLRDLYVDFDEGTPYTVLVGENGAGKSNLLEALTIIFRNLDLELKAPFDYTLKYVCRDRHIRIEAKKDEFPQFWWRETADDEYAELSRRRFMEDDKQGPLYRPAFVFGYYSGPSDRLSSLYEKHRERYYEEIIKDPARRRTADPNALRRLFYAETLHGQFALIAFFMAPGDDAEADRQFLRDHLQIDGLDSVLFALKRPPWRRKGGDSRFWSAVGEVQQFLDRLYSEALLPIRMDRRIPVDLTKNPDVESLYLFLSDAEALSRVYQLYGNQYAFFTALESTHLSKLLGEVRTRVRMTEAAGGGEVTYRDLSEGEQQLLLVLGLLKFTARNEALFLLDEPDTHLNPAWSTQYLDFLDQFIRGRSSSCHLIMTTHDPLVFSRLERPQVRIFRRDGEGKAIADAPLHDPQGMGIQAILASDLFRLPSAGLDPQTQEDLSLQRRLIVKPDLSADEEADLRAVTERLNDRGFWKNDRDPIYQIFLQKFLPRWMTAEKVEWAQRPALTVDQTRDREALADEIAAEVTAELAAERDAAQ
jgi:predicted ATPase